MKEKVCVIGAGTMGNGIAHIFALKGFQVALYDVSEMAIEKALKTIAKNLDRMVRKEILSEMDKESCLNQIHSFNDIKKATKDAFIVIEAASENINIKKEIFKEISDLVEPDTILASNTSSISITDLASVCTNPERVIGMHFMNPVPIMKLVEIINAYSTDAKITQTVFQLSEKLGKIPVIVNDYPGFISNRVLMPMINEAIYALYEGVAGVQEIDTVMKLGMAHPMGPLQLADFIGLDVCLAILNVLKDGFGNQKYAPCPLLINMVAAGKLGKKSSEGFYEYTHGTKELIVSSKFK